MPLQYLLSSDFLSSGGKLVMVGWLEVGSSYRFLDSWLKCVSLDSLDMPPQNRFMFCFVFWMKVWFIHS